MMHRLRLLGLLLLTACAVAAAEPHSAMPAPLAASIRIALAAILACLWAAWWQADRRTQ